MTSDLAANLLTARTAQTQQSVQLAVVKKQHEMEMNLVTMLTEATVAPPASGQGLYVNKRA